MKNLLLILAISISLFWLTNFSQWADRIPSWVQAVAWILLILSSSLSDDKTKDGLKEKWKSISAWLSDSLFAYDILVRFSVPDSEKYSSVFQRVEESLDKRGFKWSIGLMTKNVRQYRISQPPITISIRATPDHDIDDWEGEPQTRLEISGVDPQVINYRERGGQQVSAIISLMHDLAFDVHHAFPGDTKPQILMTINRLKGRQSSRRPQPPLALKLEEVGSGVRVRKDNTAIQVFSPNTAGILRELQTDIGQLDPVS